MKIALASPPFPKSINDGLYWLEKLVKDAVKEQAEIICFPVLIFPATLVWNIKLKNALRTGWGGHSTFIGGICVNNHF